MDSQEQGIFKFGPIHRLSSQVNLDLVGGYQVITGDMEQNGFLISGERYLFDLYFINPLFPGFYRVPQRAILLLPVVIPLLNVIMADVFGITVQLLIKCDLNTIRAYVDIIDQEAFTTG